MREAIRIDCITVYPDRITCEVSVNPDYRMTNEQLAHRITSRFPDLIRHACVNKEGSTFGAVIDHTSLAHLLEHIAIDLQATYSGSSETLFVGWTEWTDKTRTKASVEVNFTDDLVALRSFRDASKIVNEAVLQ